MRPENTHAAFEYAIGVGVDAIELDVGVTRDDVPVVWHDPVLGPPLCSGPSPGAAIRELTLDEVKQWDCGAHFGVEFAGTRISTLSEVLALAAASEVRLDIELKSFPERPEYAPPPREFARLVLREVRKFRLEERVNVMAFDVRTLHAVRELAPEIRRTALVEEDPRDFVTIAGEAGNAAVVAPQYDLVTRAKVGAAHGVGLQVVPWTVNTESDWERMVAAEVDGIISDDPAGLIIWLGSRELR